MRTSTVAGRQAALRLMAIQSAVVALLALAYSMVGLHSALAVLVGGGAVVLGGVLLAQLALGGGVSAAGVVLGRLLGGMALKWCVIGLALYLALGPWALPAGPVLFGVVAASLAQVLFGKLNQFQGDV
ncbi:MAG: hypothetical protein Q8L45_04800 [Xanthomonadaceae bacterium]|nr:hypothetical protein [Xanthomonadaceae bacterium]MDP2184804.1 hypothetical protein [Xanthomonadales bacterium]MDZ4116028.1 hypothetical protein [Xanthomonadaceae bacterium]MDZ4378406.1 hypothetical protein [Xanthomonadaceae bacterium]